MTLPPHTARARQLLRAAADLFGTRGYAAVGMDDIAARVGTTGPSIYRHFDTKYDLLTTLHLAAARRLTRGVSEDDPLSIRTLAASAVAVRRSLGTFRRDRHHLLDSDKETVGAALTTVYRSLSRTVRSGRPDLSPSGLDNLTLSVMSLASSIGTHRTALAAGATTALMAGTANRVLSVTMSDRTTTSGEPPIAGIAPVGRRESLLGAASVLFDARDPADVAVTDIAAAVGLAPATIYRYFGSKTAILSELCSGAARRSAESTARILAGTGDPHRALTELIRARAADSALSPTPRVLRRHLMVVDASTRRALVHMARQERAEWVNLLTLIRPDVGRVHAAFMVEAAFTMIDDMAGSLSPDVLEPLIAAVFDIDQRPETLPRPVTG
ncbi:MAG: helix-turn-helix domain-containing protein [Rhodococcus sp. (in: high G+C Gram-positive bacteria)]